MRLIWRRHDNSVRFASRAPLGSAKAWGHENVRMIDHIMREAIPPLRTFLEQPSEATFKQGMTALLAAMQEDENHSGADGAWKDFRLASIQPPVTKTNLKAWAAGKVPDDPTRLVESILTYLQKQGIAFRPSGKRPAVPPAVAAVQPFGRPMTSMSAQAATQALAHSPFNPPPAGGQPVPQFVFSSPDETLQDRMMACSWTDLMDAALRWQGDAATPPLTLARYLFACRERLPQDAVERVMMPLGVGAHYFHRWCHAAEGNASVETLWPDGAFQLRMMRQFLALFTLVELNAPVPDADRLAWRLAAALTLLSPEEVLRACQSAQALEPVAGAWSGLSSHVLHAWTTGPQGIPFDPPLIQAIQAALTDQIYPRFRTATW